MHGMDHFKINFLSMAFFEGGEGDREGGGEFKCWARSVSNMDMPWIGCLRYKGLVSGRGRSVFLLP